MRSSGTHLPRVSPSLPNESTVSGTAPKRYPFSVVRERLRSHSGDYLDFAFGRHLVSLPSAIVDEVRRHPESALERCSAEETNALIDSAAEFFSRLYGIRLTPNSIFPAPGGRMAMNALGAALLRHGDAVLVTEPTYPVFERIAAQLHAKVLVAPLDPGREFAPVLDTLAGEQKRRIRIVALNYPNNPTGRLLSPAARAELRGGLDHEIIWFNDATYAPLTYDVPPQSLLAVDDASTTIELHSLVKIFALGPLSIAFLVGDESVLSRVREYSEFVWSPLSSLQARLAQLCLDDPQHVEKVRDALRSRLARLRDVLEQHGFEVFQEQAGMYLLCRAPSNIGGRPVESANAAAELMLSEHGVAVVPWDVSPHNYLRFSGMYLAEELDALRDLAGGGKLVQP
jgi:aspartate/methionine/tyrosine aminotransferase